MRGAIAIAKKELRTYFYSPVAYVIIGIFLLVRGRSGDPPWTRAGQETGIDVLERRFAEGELSLEQYRERRSVLEENR
mgnify:CR=1 FL=1